MNGALPTVPQIKRLLNYARSQNWTVIHVIREHDKAGIDVDKPRRYLFQNGGKGYCVAGTEGAQIIEDLHPLENEIVLKKTRISAFFGTNLDFILRRLGIENVIISGTQYPNCIRGTAADAMSYDYDVTVVTDCCSAKSEEVALANITDMKNMGIGCVTLDELINAYVFCSMNYFTSGCCLLQHCRPDFHCQCLFQIY